MSLLDYIISSHQITLVNATTIFKTLLMHTVLTRVTAEKWDIWLNKMVYDVACVTYTVQCTLCLKKTSPTFSTVT